MALKVKIEPIDDFISLVVKESLSPESRSKAVADFAEQKFLEVDAANRRVLGHDAPHTTAVDGKPEAPLETVKPDGGVIVFEWELVSEVLQWIYERLIEVSPEISGAYKKGHQLFIDGQQQPVWMLSRLGTKGIPPADEYVFANLVPYARRLEVGKTTSGRDFVIQVPNHIYERVGKEAKGRFGNIVDIGFNYVTLANAYQVKGTFAFKNPRYATGKIRKQTQTHWVGTGADGTPAHWETYRAGEPVTRLRRGRPGPVGSPAIIVKFKRA